MFTIDLLKGEGIPAKSRPKDIAIASVMIVVPTIIAIVMLGLYLRNKITISIQKKEIVRCEGEINKLSDAVKAQKSLVEEQNIVSNCILEVRSSFGRHTQWSPILAEVVKNMPYSVALTSLGVKQHSAKKKVPKEGDAEKMADIQVLIRTLHMSAYGSAQSNCDEAVKEFRDRLMSSPFLGPKLENITVSQKYGIIDGQDTASYEIDCIFKPEM